MTTTLTACEPAAPVAWEPCAEARVGEAASGCCDRCGWPVEDHPGDGAPAARAA